MFPFSYHMSYISSFLFPFLTHKKKKEKERKPCIRTVWSSLSIHLFLSTTYESLFLPLPLTLPTNVIMKVFGIQRRALSSVPSLAINAVCLCVGKPLQRHSSPTCASFSYLLSLSLFLFLSFFLPSFSISSLFQSSLSFIHCFQSGIACLHYRGSHILTGSSDEVYSILSHILFCCCEYFSHSSSLQL